MEPSFLVSGTLHVGLFSYPSVQQTDSGEFCEITPVRLRRPQTGRLRASWADFSLTTLERGKKKEFQAETGWPQQRVISDLSNQDWQLCHGLLSVFWGLGVCPELYFGGFFPPFHVCVLNLHCVPNTGLGAQDTAGSKTDNPLSIGRTAHP